MANKETKHRFVVEFPLKTTPEQEAFLHKSINTARRLYNQVIAESLKRYNEMRFSREYIDIQKILKAEREKREEDGKKGRTEKEREAYKRLNQLYYDFGFTDFKMQDLARIKRNKAFKTQLGAQMAQLIGKQAWSAWHRVLFGNGQKVHFAKFDSFNSVAAKSNKTGIRFIKDYECKNWVGKKDAVIYMKMPIPVIVNYKSPYEQQALQCDVVCNRVIRRFIKGKYRFFVQVTFDGLPPIKFNKETGELRTLGEGTVGVRIGLNSIIAVNKDKTFKYVFKGDTEIQKEIAEIQAKMNRSMVANNPDNYNEDGTAKKGRRKWVRSNRYFKLRNRMRELRRISIVRRRIEYHEVANIIAQMGESFVINKIDFKNLQERKPLEQNPDGSFKSRKNQGEKIRAHAPAEMVSYLVTRITSLNGQVSYVNEKDLKLNTYDHISGKHERTPEINQLDPKVYYAFLLSNIRGGKVDRKECETSFQAWRNNISA